MAFMEQGGKPSAAWSRIAKRIRVPLGFAFAAFYLWRAKPAWTSLLIGAAVALLGIFLRAVASGQVEKNRVLATSGPYAYVRNPLYLGSIIIGIGFTIAARDLWVLIAIVLLFIVIYLPVIRSEEAFLRSRFPQYDDYARRVPSLLPHTLLLRQITKGFSRELYFSHREYNSLLGAAAVVAALVAKILWFPG
jgi:protein-S-isoprenylcysteine O-methyltransferase Ste14